MLPEPDVTARLAAVQARREALTRELEELERSAAELENRTAMRRRQLQFLAARGLRGQGAYAMLGILLGAFQLGASAGLDPSPLQMVLVGLTVALAGLCVVDGIRRIGRDDRLLEPVAPRVRVSAPAPEADTETAPAAEEELGEIRPRRGAER